MSERNRAEPAIALLMVVSARTRLVKRLAGTLLGDRTVFDIDGGSFEGPNIGGRILASGGDWLTRTVTGSQMDVRMLLETDDGVAILFRYSGRASQRDGEPHIEVAGSFDAPEGRYAWLNNVQTFGLGEPTPEGVRYHFFRFTFDQL